MFGRKPLQDASAETTTGRPATPPPRRCRVIIGVIVVCLGVLVGVGGLVGVASAADDGTAIDSCQAINANGSYYLNTSLTSGSSLCLNINATDVVVDGNGESIENFDTAVKITATTNATNITVRNLTIRNAADEGVRTVTGSSNSTRNLTISNVTMEDVDTGFYVPSSSESTPRVEFAIRNSSINATSRAIYVLNDKVDQYDVELNDTFINTTTGQQGVRFSLTDNGTDLNVSMFHNTIESAESGVSLNLERSHAITELELRENEINVSGNLNDRAIDLDNSDSVDGVNMSIDVEATNNTLESTGTALFFNTLQSGEGSRDIEFANNTIEASDPDAKGYDVDATGENTSVNFTVLDNTIDSGDNQLLKMQDSGSYPNQTLDAKIERNKITNEISIRASGSRGPANISVRDNTVPDSQNDVSLDIDLKRDNASLAVDMRRNEMNGSMFVTGGGAESEMELNTTNNTVEAPGTAIDLKVQPNDAANQSIEAVVSDNRVNGTGGSISVVASAPSSTANVTISDNSLTETGTNEGLLVRADRDNMTFDATIRNNTVSDPPDIAGIKTSVNGHDTTANVSLTNNTVDAKADAVSLFPRGDDQILDIDVEDNDLNITTTGSDRNGILVGQTERNSTVDISAVDNSINSTGRGIDLDPGHDEGDEDDPIDIDLRGNVINASTEGVIIRHVGSSEQLTDRNVTVSMDGNIIEDAGTGVDMDIQNSFGTDNVTLADNRIDVNKYALYFTLDGGEMNLDLSATNNTLDGTTENGARLILTDSTAPGLPGTREINISTNEVTAGTDGLYLIADSVPGLTVNFTALDNTIFTGQYDDGILAEVSEDQMTVDAEVSGNEIGVNDGSGIEIETFSSGMNTTLTVTDNVIDPGARTGIGLRGGDGDTQNAIWRVNNNSIEQAETGIHIEKVKMRDAGSYDVTIRQNNVTNTSEVGLEITPKIGTGTSAQSGAVDAIRNNISSAGTTVRINDGPVAGIDLSKNRFDANSWGVENLNTTAGYVNATDNYWGASDDPGSPGDLEDPVTGVLANGTGSNVTERGSGVSNVHFGSYLTTPPDLSGTTDFTVSIDGTNAPVTESKTLTVDATVNNTGTANGTQTVTLSADGSDRDSTNLELNSSESQSVALNWTTSEGDDGSYTATVETADDSDTESVDVTAASDGDDDDDTTSGGGGGGSASTPDDENDIDAEPAVEETSAIEESSVDFETTETVGGVTFDEEATGSVEVEEYDEPPAAVDEAVSEVVNEELAPADGANGDDSTAEDGTAAGGGGDTDPNVVTVADVSPTDPDAEESSATVEFEVDREKFDDPDDAVVFHETDDGWKDVETTVEETDGGTLTVAGQIESFSLFAVAEIESDESTQTDASTGEETTDDGDTSESADDTGDDDSGGVGAVVIGILVVIGGIGAVYVLRQQSST